MRTVFDSQLALLDAQMLVMASSMEEAVVGAVEVLETRDKERARAIMEGDDDIDHQEREIEALCLKLLLTQQPVAGAQDGGRHGAHRRSGRRRGRDCAHA